MRKLIPGVVMKSHVSHITNMQSVRWKRELMSFIDFLNSLRKIIQFIYIYIYIFFISLLISGLNACLSFNRYTAGRDLRVIVQRREKVGRIDRHTHNQAVAIVTSLYDYFELFYH